MDTISFSNKKDPQTNKIVDKAIEKMMNGQPRWRLGSTESLHKHDSTT